LLETKENFGKTQEGLGFELLVNSNIFGIGVIAHIYQIEKKYSKASSSLIS